jgi:hypothetical protein
MSDEFDIERLLLPVRRAMTLRQVVRWTVAGTALGAILAAVALVALRAHGSGPVAPVLACVALPVAAAILSLVFRPSLTDAARRADVHFGLHDRLTTALEFRTSNEPLIVRQRRQAVEATGGKRLPAAAGRWVARRELAAAVVALALACGLFVAPAPTPSQASSTSATELARIRRLASQEIPALTRQLPQKNLAAARQAHRVLARLEAQLRHARTKAQALRAISLAQQQLAHIRAGLKPVDRSTAAAIARGLHSYIPEAKGPPALQAARALSSISKKLNHASSAQKQKISRDLLKAANAARDKKTRSLLRKAASAVGYGEKHRAQKALKQAARRVHPTSGTHNLGSQLGTASKQLDAAKYHLSPSHLGKLQGAPFSPGKSKYSHERANSLSSTNQSPRARRIVGSHGAQGLNGKRRTGDSGQPGDSGGHSLGKQLDSSGHGKVKRFGVQYLKGKLTQGTYQVQLGPNGRAQKLGASRYQHVVARYAQTAEDALSRTSLPPSLHTYVRRYFVVLSHP